MARTFRFASLYSAAAVLALSSMASAITISGSGTTAGDGDVISATADVTLGDGTVTVVLTNTTPETRTAGQLLTGFDLSLAGVSSGSLLAGSAMARTVDDTGAFVDLGIADLTTAGNNGNPTWSVIAGPGGALRLNFNPDASFGIIGAPTAGSYAGANGSITGNSGHNPYAAETATFTIDAPGVTAGTTITSATFLFGTDFASLVPGTIPPGGGIGEPPPDDGGIGTPPPIPEPTSIGLLGLALGGLMLRMRKR